MTMRISNRVRSYVSASFASPRLRNLHSIFILQTWIILGLWKDTVSKHSLYSEFDNFLKQNTIFSLIDNFKNSTYHASFGLSPDKGVSQDLSKF